ncbi:syntenin-1 isoform X2 [Strongylocentrotus purpuratus]|uniref:PDZ domain-containing protein n=1 Tax=Strongylocentrotus purpuratus TaxID=7668 RepID=A0A7M7HJJ7_STRPU|nr:syntenin-1 isoform X2 [Strongylocentrotus purpuratus]|eukprot:XP_011670371.1 PREDICTED: syntenin-1 isoform X2 [Strongylocentrotus purpuratus]
MSLYPSLEDMKVDKMAQAQDNFNQQAQAAAHAIAAAPPGSTVVMTTSSLYPSLEEWMGLPPAEMQAYAQQSAVVPRPAGTVAVQSQNNTVAPVTGTQNLGVARSEIKQGVREVVVCKDAKGKIGLRVRDVSKGIFITFVMKDSPGAMGGLRFGDQILQINGENVAGYSKDKAMGVLKKASPGSITLAIRDRPFERTITLQKDSAGYVGFVFKNGKVTKIAKDTSAARNGLLIDHAILEINGQNVIGLKDKDISQILDGCGRSITLTIMPNFFFDHMMKSMASSLVKSSMDHSVPEI